MDKEQFDLFAASFVDKCTEQGPAVELEAFYPRQGRVVLDVNRQVQWSTSLAGYEAGRKSGLHFWQGQDWRMARSNVVGESRSVRMEYERIRNGGVERHSAVYHFDGRGALTRVDVEADRSSIRYFVEIGLSS